MIDTDGLDKLIADARQVPVQRTGERVIDLTGPGPKREIRIPEATVAMLEDYELYVG